MEKISVAFAGLAVIIAMTILQGCVGTARTAGTQCAKPTLIPLDATHATMTVTVRIATNTAGAYLRYTLDGSTPTGGSSGNGMQIAAAERESLVHGRIAGKDVKSDCVQTRIGRFADRRGDLRLRVAV